MSRKQTVQTDLIHQARPKAIPTMGLTTVNQPVYHCSSLIYKDFAERDAWSKRFEATGEVGYGIGGTDLTYAYEGLLAKLENAAGAIAVSSGLAAITAPLIAVTKAGDHVLIVDSAYGPTRRFANEILSNFGIEVEYYDPALGSDIERLVKPNTSVIFLESPGSVTFEIQDLSAIAAVAQKHGITTMIDNTWATPMFLKPLDFGIDISIHATTKYIGGHSDLMGGAVICNEATHVQMRKAIAVMGHHAAPDDVFLALRGLRTLDVRLERHEKNGLEVARWLEQQPLIRRVLHPGLESFDGHELFKKYFTGATSLFGIQFEESVSTPQAKAFAERLHYFALAASWGGFESLVLHHEPAKYRSPESWPPAEGLGGPLIRLHIGLEDPADLIKDLGEALSEITEG